MVREPDGLASYCKQVKCARILLLPLPHSCNTPGIFLTRSRNAALKTPMTPADFFANRPAVGSALWLYEYLAWNTQLTEDSWIPVADGVAFTDEYLGYRLDVTATTVGRWRKLLEKLGYVRTQLVRPRYRKMWLPNMQTPTRQQTLIETPVNAAVN